MTQPWEWQDNSGFARAWGSPPRPAPFGRFQELPAEIRIMIWKEAAMTARLINLLDQKGGSALKTGRLPPLLCVNSESRRVALKHYILRFTFEFRFDRSFPNKPHWLIKSTGRYYGPLVRLKYTFRRNVIMSAHDVLAFFGSLTAPGDHPGRYYRHVSFVGIRATDEWTSKIKRAAVPSIHLWENHQRIPESSIGPADLQSIFRMEAGGEVVCPAPSDCFKDKGEGLWEEKVFKKFFETYKGDFRGWVRQFSRTRSMEHI